MDRQKLIGLIDEIDRELPPCTDNDFQMKAYLRVDDLLDPIRQGKLVVVSRGMFRQILRALETTPDR